MKYMATAIISAAYTSMWWAYVVWKKEQFLIIPLVLGILAIIFFCLYALLEI